MPSQQNLAHVDTLEALYRDAVGALRGALSQYIATGERPDPAARAAGVFCYPEIRVRYDGAPSASAPGRAFGRLGYTWGMFTRHSRARAVCPGTPWPPTSGSSRSCWTDRLWGTLGAQTDGIHGTPTDTPGK